MPVVLFFCQLFDSCKDDSAAEIILLDLMSPDNDYARLIITRVFTQGLREIKSVNARNYSILRLSNRVNDGQINVRF